MSNGAEAEHSEITWLELEAPRYTSYPSAHHFSAKTNEKTQAGWLASIVNETTISAYVHIPFCKELCWFCGCHTKMTKRYDPIEKYVRVLLQEIALIKEYTGGKGRLINIHFGGGSPSLLKYDDWLSILCALASVFKSSPPGELAIELDPRTTTSENILAYAKLGFNRVSLGIQDFNSEVQQAINRIQPYEMVASMVERLRQTGLGNINCDLIYGLPHQTFQRFRDTVEKTLSLDPARISLFSYAHMPQIKKHQRFIDTTKLPSVSEKLELFIIASEILADNGYVSVGIDHFAKSTDPLAVAMKNRTMRRNFQGYVTDTTDVLIGIGSSSISQFPQGYTQNSANTSDYTDRVRRGVLPTIRGWTNGADDLARKRIIDALMCFMSVNLVDICQEFHLPQQYFELELQELQRLQQHGVVALDGSFITVITPYRMAARIVASVFDRYRGAVVNGYSQVA